MRQPPAFEQDYVFIVDPDTWTFLDKASFNHPLTAQLFPTMPKRPVASASEYDDAMARFISSKKRKPLRTVTAPATPTSLAPASARAFMKRPLLSPSQTPTKKPRLSPTSSTIIAVYDTEDSLSQDSFYGGDDPNVAPPTGQSAADPASSKPQRPTCPDLSVSANLQRTFRNRLEVTKDKTSEIDNCLGRNELNPLEYASLTTSLLCVAERIIVGTLCL